MQSAHDWLSEEIVLRYVDCDWIVNKKEALLKETKLNQDVFCPKKVNLNLVYVYPKV